MRHIVLISLIVLSLIGISACGGSAPANNAAANNTPASNNPLETKTPAADTVTNDAPTLTPMFKAYCAAKMKNDEAALRKLYSSDTIKSFEEQMKDDNIKTLAKFLEDDKVSDKLCQVKNEKITGDSAVAKIFIDSYPNGLDVYFVKENGEWKMTNRSPQFEAVKHANTAANTANTAK